LLFSAIAAAAVCLVLFSDASSSFSQPFSPLTPGLFDFILILVLLICSILFLFSTLVNLLDDLFSVSTPCGVLEQKKIELTKHRPTSTSST
jgi:hypothetical protein